jgi:hypothetical protein
MPGLTAANGDADYPTLPWSKLCESVRGASEIVDTNNGRRLPFRSQFAR